MRGGSKINDIALQINMFGAEKMEIDRNVLKIQENLNKNSKNVEEINKRLIKIQIELNAFQTRRQETAKLPVGSKDRLIADLSKEMEDTTVKELESQREKLRRLIMESTEMGKHFSSEFRKKDKENSDLLMRIRIFFETNMETIAPLLFGSKELSKEEDFVVKNVKGVYNTPALLAELEAYYLHSINKKEYEKEEAKKAADMAFEELELELKKEEDEKNKKNLTKKKSPKKKSKAPQIEETQIDQAQTKEPKIEETQIDQTQTKEPQIEASIDQPQIEEPLQFEFYSEDPFEMEILPFWVNGITTIETLRKLKELVNAWNEDPTTPLLDSNACQELKKLIANYSNVMIYDPFIYDFTKVLSIIGLILTFISAILYEKKICRLLLKGSASIQVYSKIYEFYNSGVEKAIHDLDFIICPLTKLSALEQKELALNISFLVLWLLTDINGKDSVTFINTFSSITSGSPIHLTTDGPILSIDSKSIGTLNREDVRKESSVKIVAKSNGKYHAVVDICFGFDMLDDAIKGIYYDDKKGIKSAIVAISEIDFMLFSLNPSAFLNEVCYNLFVYCKNEKFHENAYYLSKILDYLIAIYTVLIEKPLNDCLPEIKRIGQVISIEQYDKRTNNCISGLMHRFINDILSVYINYFKPTDPLEPAHVLSIIYQCIQKTFNISDSQEQKDILFLIIEDWMKRRGA